MGARGNPRSWHQEQGHETVDTAERDRKWRCRTCLRTKDHRYKEYHRQWSIRNRARLNERRRGRRQAEGFRSVMKKYGLTVDSYVAMLAAQSGCCAICGGTPGGKRRLDVDHDHETGRVRGLLCVTCNTGIGALSDSVELLEAAIAYLKKGEPCP